MTWGPHDLRLAKALADQRLEAAHRAGVDLKRPLWVRGAPERSGGHARVRLQWPFHRHWPVHLHRPAHGAAGHH